MQLIAPGFGGINLEDISAPRCFEVERRLRGLLDIPVFHDDQHGTAIVVLAALTNALRVVGKELADVRIVMAGRGRRGHRRPQAAAGRGRHGRELVVCDDQRRGPPREARPGREPGLDRRAHQRRRLRGRPGRARCVGADVFIGLSAPASCPATTSAAMAPDAIVFALANPDPEVDPDEARGVCGRGGHRPQRLSRTR